MLGRLALLLAAATTLAACREPMADGRERGGGPLDEVASRGSRAFSAVTGRDEGYAEDEPGGAYLRGVRDGLDDAEFNRDERSEAYARGYEAGLREMKRGRQRLEVEDRPPPDERRRPARRVDERRTDDRADDGRRTDYAAADEYRRVGAGFGPTNGGRQPPREAMRACADEVEDMFGLPDGSAAPVTSRPRGNGGYQVAVRAGPRQAVCVLTADGEVKSVDER